MKKYKKKRDFASFIVTIIMLLLITGLGVFIYFCMSYGVEETIAGVSENLSQFWNDEKKEEKNEISLSLAQNPIESIEQISNNGSETASVEKYYYNQIDNKARIIYDALESNIENLKTGNYTIELGEAYNTLLNQENGSQLLNDAYQAALDAFVLDKPEVFYIDTSKMLLMIYSKTTILKTTYTVSIKAEEGGTYFADGFSSKEQVEEAENQLEWVRQNLYEKLSGDIPDKVEQMHDCLIDSLEYDQTLTRTNTRNIYGALIEREVVCEGYAKAYKYLLDGLGIPNVIAVGTGTNSSGQTEAHAWNYVEIEGSWYAVDVTWDDPVVIGGGKLPKRERQKHLLKGSETFNKNHQETGKVSDSGKVFTYPKLSEEEYK